LAFLFINPRLSWWRVLLRALFCAIGLWYAASSLIANYLIWQGMNSPPEIALAKFERAAAVFPLKVSFCELPAYALIYFVSGLGLDGYRSAAIVALEQAVLRSPNSTYLRDHLKRLKR
jgi:hypothetical protein